MQANFSYCSTNSMCFLSEPFSGVNVNAPGRVTPIELCLQTPGRDDVTSPSTCSEHYARASHCARALRCGNDVCWTYRAPFYV